MNRQVSCNICYRLSADAIHLRTLVLVLAFLIAFGRNSKAQLVVTPGNATLCAGEKVDLSASSGTGAAASTWSVAPAGSGVFSTTTAKPTTTFRASAAHGDVTITATSGADTGATTLHLNGLCVDDRGAFNASFYVGLAIDTFAGDETL